MFVCVYQSPEHRKHSGCSEYEETAQSFRVVGSYKLYHPQQGFDSWSPQMSHI